ncbi:MAG TPA: hypothetical protein VFA20_26255 [Myxococcaceae bacterium]|nr:hypothetical protein [Myxococcaceae bacterium]
MAHEHNPHQREMSDESMPRNLAAQIEAWRDGYTDVICEGNAMSREDVLQWWRELIACVRDPRGYAVWQLPVWTATR